MMIKGDPEDGMDFFLSQPHTKVNNGLFFLLTMKLCLLFFLKSVQEVNGYTEM